MTRSRLKNKYNKKRSYDNKRNFSVKLLRQTKQDYFNNINVKIVRDTKKF